MKETVTLKWSTLSTLGGTILAVGMWAGALQLQVVHLKAEVLQDREATKASHTAMMAKLEQIDARIVELQLSLETEKTEQRMLHKGQIPPARK